MQSRKLRSQVGKDGILHLDIPVGVTDKEIEVMVIYQLLEPSAQAKTPEELGWPPGFFEQTAGSLQDDPIAAIALVHQLTLVTHNTKEFARVKGLQIEDWEEEG